MGTNISEAEFIQNLLLEMRSTGVPSTDRFLHMCKIALEGYLQELRAYKDEDYKMEDYLEW